MLRRNYTDGTNLDEDDGHGLDHGQEEASISNFDNEER